MRTFALLTGTLLLAAAGCGNESWPESRDALTAGWTLRLDEPNDPSRTIRATRFLQHSDGVEARPGPNACLWNAELRAIGNYRLSVDVTHLDSGEHPHGAGLTFGGTEVDGEEQRYTYFLVRSDQRFLIKSRIGESTSDIVSWTRNDAVAPEDDQGVTRNRLSVEVSGDEVRFLVNGTEVHRSARADTATEGQVGLRLVHDIHVKFGTPSIQQL